MYRMLLITAMIAVIVVAFYWKSRTEKAQASQILIAAASNAGQNSQVVNGVYHGTLPCAGCQGIQKTISLSEDLNYCIKVKYLGKQDSARQVTGKFSWNEQAGTITLKEPDDQAVSYFVGEGTLTQLDARGNKITGQLAGKYVLSKEGEE